MAEQIIEFEAESLEEAREQLKAQISEGFHHGLYTRSQ